jgi:hypothetical protein
MQGVPQTSFVPGSDPPGPVMMWLEKGEGGIARGTAVALSRERASVRLTETASLAPGDDVAVRLSFDRNTDTVAGAGRVLTMRANGEAPVCELEWTHTGPEREQLESLINARS